jgi:hypothetical protein
MTFRRDFFETFSNHIDGIVYFADKSQLKPSGIGSIRLRLPGLVNYILHDVLYIPQLNRNIMSLIHIRQQGHSIHMFDGIIEIRKASDQVIVMIGVEVQLSPCNACILGKHCKQPFYGSTSRASRKLGLIHSDLCGPMPVQSANGNKYLLTFIDDYTRMCWVYLLKEKSQVFATFKNFHLWITNETQLNIGTL